MILLGSNKILLGYQLSFYFKILFTSSPGICINSKNAVTVKRKKKRKKKSKASLNLVNIKFLFFFYKLVLKASIFFGHF